MKSLGVSKVRLYVTPMLSTFFKMDLLMRRPWSHMDCRVGSFGGGLCWEFFGYGL